MEKLPQEKWMDERNVEVHMEKAKRTVPEHADKAEKWLSELRKWQVLRL